MVGLEREPQNLRKAVFHVEQPQYNAENAQHARFPGEPQSCQVGHGLSSPKAGDLCGRLPIRVNLSEAIAQPLPFRGHSHLIATADLRYIGLARRSPQRTRAAETLAGFTPRYEIWDGQLKCNG